MQSQHQLWFYWKCFKNHDSVNAIEWFTKICMEAKASKFQFVLIESFNNKEEIPNFIEISYTRIERESQVNLLKLLLIINVS